MHRYIIDIIDNKSDNVIAQLDTYVDDDIMFDTLVASWCNHNDYIKNDINFEWDFAANVLFPEDL